MARAIARQGAIVPPVFRLEVQNGMLIAVRRGRLTTDVVLRRFEDLDSLALSTDTFGGGYSAGYELARRFQLTAYDASYLELAVRAGKLLMTRDRDLVAAARELGVLWSPGDPSTSSG